MKWYRLAAQQGYARAQRNLGLMYYGGQGVAQDYAEAVKWPAHVRQCQHAAASTAFCRNSFRRKRGRPVGVSGQGIARRGLRPAPGLWVSRPGSCGYPASPLQRAVNLLRTLDQRSGGIEVLLLSIQHDQKNRAGPVALSFRIK